MKRRHPLQMVALRVVQVGEELFVVSGVVSSLQDISA